MKICPKCKAELDDNARFCLSCMTSLDKKTQIPQSVRKRRLWPFALIFAVLLLAVTCIWRFTPTQEPSVAVPDSPPATTQVLSDAASQPTETAGTITPTTGNPAQDSPVYPQSGTNVPTGTTASTTPTSSTPTTAPTTPSTPTTAPTTPSTPTTAPTTKPSGTTEPKLYTKTVKGVTYVMRQATAQESPNSGGLILIDVQGTSSDGIYYVPSSPDSGPTCHAIADGAFDSVSNLRILELPWSIEYVWGNAFGGNALERVHFENTFIHIDRQAFSGCSSALLIVADNSQAYDRLTGVTWRQQAADFGFIFKFRNFGGPPGEDVFEGYD